MEFNFKIKGDKLISGGILSGNSGNVNMYTCRFKIVENADFTWLCVFKQGDEAYQQVIENGSCIIPKEMLENSGEFRIGCYGSDGNARISTNWLEFSVADGAYCKATVPKEPTPDVWESLITRTLPYIGENGNWYVYDKEQKIYKDSGSASRGEKGDKGSVIRYWVSKEGSDNNPGTSKELPLATFAKAIHLGAEEIYIKSGTYNERIVANPGQNLKIRPYDGESVVIERTENTSSNYMVRAEQCDVDIEGVKVRNSNRYGFMLWGCTGTVKNCVAENNKTMGFSLDGSKMALYNCEANYNGTDGFNAHAYNQDGKSYTSDCVFYDCKATNNADDGLSFHDVSYMKVYGGEYSKNGQGGITPFGGTITTVNGAIIKENDIGLYAFQNAGSDKAPIIYSYNNYISGNRNGIVAKYYNIVSINDRVENNDENDTMIKEGGIIDR